MSRYLVGEMSQGTVFSHSPLEDVAVGHPPLGLGTSCHVVEHRNSNTVVGKLGVVVTREVVGTYVIPGQLEGPSLGRSGSPFPTDGVFDGLPVLDHCLRSSRNRSCTKPGLVATGHGIHGQLIVRGDAPGIPQDAALLHPYLEARIPKQSPPPTLRTLADQHSSHLESDSRGASLSRSPG